MNPTLCRLIPGIIDGEGESMWACLSAVLYSCTTGRDLEHRLLYLLLNGNAIELS